MFEPQGACCGALEKATDQVALKKGYVSSSSSLEPQQPHNMVECVNKHRM
jgi:hypothetical protein